MRLSRLRERLSWETLTEQVEAGQLAGDQITSKLTRAPFNDAPIGGLKVVTANGWFAARPSEPKTSIRFMLKFYQPEHLATIQLEAQAIVDAALKS
jgi:phosphoglucomutase